MSFVYVLCSGMCGFGVCFARICGVFCEDYVRLLIVLFIIFINLIYIFGVLHYFSRAVRIMLVK